tara:strand:- start:31390 stop:31596 length:207 start_codon:yes stop_codon:yes gene_type:complete
MIHYGKQLPKKLFNSEGVGGYMLYTPTSANKNQDIYFITLNGQVIHKGKKGYILALYAKYHDICFGLK